MQSKRCRGTGTFFREVAGWLTCSSEPESPVHCKRHWHRHRHLRQGAGKRHVSCLIECNGHRHRHLKKRYRHRNWHHLWQNRYRRFGIYSWANSWALFPKRLLKLLTKQVFTTAHETSFHDWSRYEFFCSAHDTSFLQCSWKEFLRLLTKRIFTKWVFLIYPRNEFSRNEIFYLLMKPVLKKRVLTR